MDNLYIFCYYFLRLLGKLPWCVLKYFASFLAFLAYHIDKKHRKIILTNFKICFLDMSENDKKQIIKSIYKNFAQYAFWYFKLLNMNKEEILQIVEFKNEDLIKNALQNNEKIVFITAHLGMWELLPSAVAMKFGCKIAIVGRDLDSEKMNEILEKNRQKNGIKLISKFNGAKNIIKSIKEGYFLGLLTDQDCDLNEGLIYEINGRKLTQSKIASKIAIKHNSTMLFTYIYKNKNPQNKKQFVIEFAKALRVDEEKSAQENEELLTRAQLDMAKLFWTNHKDEYFWFHKRFKTFCEKEYE